MLDLQKTTDNRDEIMTDNIVPLKEKINFGVWVCKENAMENFRRAKEGFKKDICDKQEKLFSKVVLVIFERWFGK